jgi:hypothetical protein
VQHFQCCRTHALLLPLIAAHTPVHIARVQCGWWYDEGFCKCDGQEYWQQAKTFQTEKWGLP